MDLSSLRTLGRSGLAVSPMALGTMTFGNAVWGSSDEEVERIISAYVESGGNFIDTADVYAKGRSEELVGHFIAKHAWRDQIVLATKFAFNPNGTNPHAGGNGKKEHLPGLGRIVAAS